MNSRRLMISSFRKLQDPHAHQSVDVSVTEQRDELPPLCMSSRYAGASMASTADDRRRELDLRTLNLPPNGCHPPGAELIVHCCD
jgi:hypothetical protein